MKFAVVLACLSACPSGAATDVWGSEACDQDSAHSVSLLQKHVRAGTVARRKPMNYGADDVGAIAEALTSEIDDVLEQTVDDEVLGRTIAKTMKNTKSQINGMRGEADGKDKGKLASSKDATPPALVLDVPVEQGRAMWKMEVPEGAPSLVVDVPVEQGRGVWQMEVPEGNVKFASNEDHSPPSFVVDVPVEQGRGVWKMEVPMMEQIPIVVDEEEDEQDEDEEDEVEDEDSQKSEDSCMASLEKLLTDEHRVKKARACEEKKGHSDAAIEALQDMDTDLAVKSIEKTFHECGGISKKCAKELAPEEMLKMRLSGVTMEQKCADVASEQDMHPNSKAASCQMKMGQGIVDALMTGDVEVALEQAQDGLSECNKIKHPCDFQLAPLLVGQLIQEQEEMGNQQEPAVQPGGMLLGPAHGFSALVDAVIKPSYYQAMLLQE